MTKPDPDSGPRIGLTLGGGGARGYAHIHVIAALSDLGLRPAVISGTSVGAVIGAAHGAGMGAGDIAASAERLAGSRKDAVRRLFTGQVGEVLEMFDPRRARGALLNGEALLALALPELARHTFQTLRIPTHVVATDFYGRCQKVLSSGPLMPALAASAALPGLLCPVEIDGCYYVDGGLTNPLPYDVIEDRVDIVVAVDVSAARQPRAGTPRAADVLLTSFQITLHALIEQKLLVRRPTVLVRPPVQDFRVLDFFKFQQIYAAAAPVRDQVKRALDAAITACERQKNPA